MAWVALFIVFYHDSLPNGAQRAGPLQGLLFQAGADFDFFVEAGEDGPSFGAY